MSMIPIGWDCYNAMNAQPPTVPGGRVFAFGCGFAYQDIYSETFGLNARGARYLAVDAIKWLRGWRSTGVIAVPTDVYDWSRAVPYEFRVRAASDREYGVALKDELTATGFTVLEYSGVTYDDVLGTADVICFSSSLTYNTTYYNPKFQTFINAENGAIFCLEAPNIATQIPYRISQQPGYVMPSEGAGPIDYVGAEVIWSRCMGAGGVYGYEVSDWGICRHTRTSAQPYINDPAYDGPWPSGRHVFWKQPTFMGEGGQKDYTYGGSGFAAVYTAHDDAGDGADWAVP